MIYNKYEDNDDRKLLLNSEYDKTMSISDDDSPSCHNRIYNPGDWIVKECSDCKMTLLIESVEILSDGKVKYACITQGGTNVEVTSDDKLRLWSIDDIEEFTNITVTVNAENVYSDRNDNRWQKEKTSYKYICVCSGRVKQKLDDMTIYCIYLLYAYDKHLHKKMNWKRILVNNEPVWPATLEECNEVRQFMVASHKSDNVESIDSSSGDVKQEIKKNTWNKSGRVVKPGDYIVRKSDGEIMCIDRELEDVFIVHPCRYGVMPMCCVNKNTDYKRYYLWSPKHISPGDIVTNGSDIMMVGRVEDKNTLVMSRTYNMQSGIFLDFNNVPQTVSLDKEELRPADMSEQQMLLTKTLE